jgi:hydrogenase maturation factor
MHSDDALGKAGREYLCRVVYNRLGANRRSVAVGPRFGVDNAVIRIGSRSVLVGTTDPLSFIPRLGARDSAWLSINLLASDLSTSGFPPQFGIFDFNLPPRMTNSQFEDYWRAFHEECRRLGVAIVGGHTGRYPGCDFSIIGGGVLWAVGSESRYLTAAMGQNGDDIILTKGAAIETTAVLTRTFPKTIRRAIGSRLFEKAWQYLHKVSTVSDSLAAITVGLHQDGVTAMHDATEGGVIEAALELADASKLGAEVYLPDIYVSDETEGICRFFSVDPLTSLSEGSLIIASRPNKTASVLGRLNSAGIQAHTVGRLTAKRSSYATTDRGRHRLKYPAADPYWKAYWTGIRKRLK